MPIEIAAAPGDVAGIMLLTDLRRGITRRLRVHHDDFMRCCQRLRRSMKFGQQDLEIYRFLVCGKDDAQFRIGNGCVYRFRLGSRSFKLGKEDCANCQMAWAKLICGRQPSCVWAREISATRNWGSNGFVGRTPKFNFRSSPSSSTTPSISRRKDSVRPLPRLKISSPL